MGGLGFSIGTNLNDHPKYSELSFEAIGAWWMGLSWCAARYRDGRLSTKAVQELSVPKAAICELVAKKILVPSLTCVGWIYCDYIVQAKPIDTRYIERLQPLS